MRAHFLPRVSITLIVCCLMPLRVAQGTEIRVPYAVGAEMKGESDGPENAVLLKFEMPATLRAVRVDRARLHLPLESIGNWIGIQAVRVAPLVHDWGVSPGPTQFSELERVDSLSSVIFIRGQLDDVTAVDITQLVVTWLSSAECNNGIYVSGLNGTGQPICMKKGISTWTGEDCYISIHYTGALSGD